MTYREAASRIKEHTKIHFSKENPHTTLITEALQMAVNVLNEKADMEECLKAIKKGSSVWFVDHEEGEIEEAVVRNVHYVDGRIDSFAVDFKESGYFDEFVGEAIGDNFFASEGMAMQALVNGRGIKG